jgi:outer membrane protein TolC
MLFCPVATTRAARRLSCGVLACLAGWVAAPAVHAQTLAQALDAAWQRAPLAAALPARQAQAQAATDSANSLTPGPAAVSVSHLSDRLNSNAGRREWEVEVATPLWLPSQRQAQQAVAGHASDELQAEAAALRLQLAAEVREAWWTVAQARSASTLARQRLDAAIELEQAVQRRYKTGDLARLDANLAQTERLQAEADGLDAERAELQARLGYQALVGTPPPDELPPEPLTAEDERLQGPAPIPADSTAQPPLRALQARVELARSRLALVDASRRDAPELALRWNNQRGDAFTPYDQAVGVKLTVPLSSDSRSRQDSAAARAELAQAEGELALLQSRLEQDQARAQADWRAAQRQLDLAEARRAATSDNLSLAQRAFTLGEIDLASLLRARTAAHEAQAALARQQVARHQALSRLHQALGLLP